MARIVSEGEFRMILASSLAGLRVRAVTGPGRSGAVASVYASHLLGVPWIPYGQPCPDSLRPILIIDTASRTGATLRKAGRRYEGDQLLLHLFDEPPRLRFWYEVSQGFRRTTGTEAE